MSEPILHQPVHLSELHVHRSSDALYVFGSVLASFNISGCYFYPGLEKSILFNSEKGNWMFINANNMHKSSLDPEVASWQFRDFIVQGSYDLMIGLIGGYARAAYQRIDPVYPGFTDTFLRHLIKGTILSVTKPRDKWLDLPQVLSDSGCSIDFKQDEQKPAFSVTSVVRNPLDDQDLLLTSIVFALAGMDITQWFQQLATSSYSSDIIQILNAISRREHLNSWDGFIPKLLGLNKDRRQLETSIAEQPYPIQCLLIFMLAVYTEDKDLDYSLSGVGLKTIRAATNELLEYAPEVRVRYLEAIMDGLDDLAKIADQQGNTYKSIELAQCSKIILQFLTNDVDGAEDRLSRSELQVYSWHNQSPEKPLDVYTVFRYLGYAGSATIADIDFFATSRDLVLKKQASNHLWTTLWIALQRQRHSIKLLAAISLQFTTWPEDELMIFTDFLKRTVQLYLKCLWQFSEAIKATLIENEPPTGYFHVFNGVPEKDTKMFLYVERECLFKLQEALEAKGFDKSSQDALHELSAILEPAK